MNAVEKSLSDKHYIAIYELQKFTVLSLMYYERCKLQRCRKVIERRSYAQPFGKNRPPNPRVGNH